MNEGKNTYAVASILAITIAGVLWKLVPSSSKTKSGEQKKTRLLKRYEDI